MAKSLDVLLNDKEAKTYTENYVAMDSIKNKKVISYGKNAARVFKEASEKGYRDFFVFYVSKNQVYIY